VQEAQALVFPECSLQMYNKHHFEVSAFRSLLFFTEKKKNPIYFLFKEKVESQPSQRTDENTGKTFR
jgi:hypothetical protein